MKTATFSNGYQDTYKGNRDVKAAWMITDKATGEVLASGHSNDRKAAEKTANGNVRFVGKSDLPHYTIPRSISGFHTGWAKSVLRQLKRDGLAPESKTHRTILEAARAANARLKAEQEASVSIEIIDL